MHRPVLRERVGLLYLPRVAVPIHRILTLHERGVDSPTRRRSCQRRRHPSHHPEDHPRHGLDHPPLRSSLLDRRVIHPLGGHSLGHHLADPAARRRRGDLLAVGIQERCLVRRVFIAGRQIEDPASGPPLGLSDHLDVPRPRRHHEGQPALGIDRHVIPAVAAMVVGRVVGVAAGLLLGDVGPFLVEPDLTGLRGKMPRPRRGVGGSARRPGMRSGPRCCGSPSPGGRWPGTPLRSARCSKIETAFSSVSWEPKRGDPFRSEKRDLQERQ